MILVAAVLLGLAPGAPASAEIYVFRDAQGVMHFSDVRYHAGYKPFRNQLRRRSRPVHASSLDTWDRVIRQAGYSHGIPPALLKAVVHVESYFDPSAVSAKGARGLMQLMPQTASELGVDDPFDPWQNIDGGTRYLSALVRHCGGDLRLALAAYHAGERTVRRYGGVPPFPDTERYVARVLGWYRRYDANFR